MRLLPGTVECSAYGRHFGHVLAMSNLGARQSRAWMHRVITLIEAALVQLHPAQGTLLEAASLLRQQIEPPAAQATSEGRSRLLAWQVRKVCDYIDTHISEPVLVEDLCSLVQRSEGYFSRIFKHTFGESPHAFVLRRRVELAAQYMLATNASLSDIALRCGFADQAHLSRHFRQFTAHTPASWRRTQKAQDFEGIAASGAPEAGVDRSFQPRVLWEEDRFEASGSRLKVASSAKVYPEDDFSVSGMTPIDRAAR